MSQANYQEIHACRICGSRELVSVLDLGNQALTGIFPPASNPQVETMPLELVKCRDEKGQGCGLLQLRHTGDLGKMYGETYGYRSGLNQSMVDHLWAKVRKIQALAKPKKGDLVIDIGSNDSTTLQAYAKDLDPSQIPDLVGIDPSGSKFKQYYPPYVRLVPEFFSAKAVEKACGSRKAKIITSFSMFYDLPEPMTFMKEVHDALADDGIWVFEQSYMPTMLEMNSYDTACHEHLEYYALKQIHWMAERVGLKLLDVEFNAVNGGSFSVSAAKKNAAYPANESRIREILAREAELGLHTLKPYEEFRERVARHKIELPKFLAGLKAEGKRVVGYGASTKGNVLLQYCGIGPDLLDSIAEVNPDKFGCVTPGTRIPIVSEKELKAAKPDVMMVLPWHFRENILNREKAYLAAGGRFLFPLPKIELK